MLIYFWKFKFYLRYFDFIKDSSESFKEAWEIDPDKA